MLFIIL